MKTLINFITKSLGDNIAFSIYADAYQKKYGGQVYVKTIWNNLFYSENVNVFFVNPSYQDSFDIQKDIYFKFQEGPMQKIVCDALNLEYEEVKPILQGKTKYNFNKKKKYVCMSVHSTAQMKYWNNNNGWKKIVGYLKSLNYDVYVIDKDAVFGTKEKWNNIPDAAINETGSYPIDYRVAQIKNCAFFIGLSSGLSWLAWALNKKVVMISGCTNEDNEFKNNCYRVINKNVCNGCLNDSSLDNQIGITTDWMYCPRNKNFECSKEISFEMVKEKIDKCILDLNEHDNK
jgi:autotransporter strand-loop-strand O-heptosyltransferase